MLQNAHGIRSVKARSHGRSQLSNTFKKGCHFEIRVVIYHASNSLEVKLVKKNVAQVVIKLKVVIKMSH